MRLQRSGNLTSDENNKGMLDPYVIMQNKKDADSLAMDLSAPALAQVAYTPGKCYGTSEILTNPFCIEFIFIQFLYCLFILTILKCIQKVLSKTYWLCIFSISSYNQCPC